MGDVDLAASMICAASQAGATWAKFQTWRVDRLSPGPWDNDGRRQIYEKAELCTEQHLLLINICKRNHIKFLSSAFSLDDARLLSSLGQEAIKIPSFEVANTKLIKYARDHFSRVIVSTGTATRSEIEDLSLIVDPQNTTVMHCVSSYPCSLETINLPRIKHLKSLFPSVGFSDHTAGITAALFSLSYDIDIIEKHFTVDNRLPGRDNKFAILPDELSELSRQIINYSKVSVDLGIDYQPIELEARRIYRGRFDNE